MNDLSTLDLFEQEPFTGNMPTPAKIIEKPAPAPIPPRPSDWNPDEPLGPCIEFQGYRDRQGYGLKRHEKKTWRANRLAWTLTNGPIPAGLQVRHICGNSACINVEHLRLGTARDNIRDALVHGTKKGGLIENPRAVYNQALFGIKQTKIANLTGVTRAAISNFATKRGLSRTAQKLTPAQRNEAARRFSAGEHADQLATEYGIAETNIRALARGRGLPKPMRSKSRASINLTGSLFE